MPVSISSAALSKLVAPLRLIAAEVSSVPSTVRVSVPESNLSCASVVAACDPERRNAATAAVLNRLKYSLPGICVLPVKAAKYSTAAVYSIDALPKYAFTSSALENEGTAPTGAYALSVRNRPLRSIAVPVAFSTPGSIWAIFDSEIAIYYFSGGNLTSTGCDITSAPVINC